jgi:microcystin degradation protein MlrC
MRGFVDRMLAREGKDGVLSISFVHGFPWGDTPVTGAKMLVYADGDEGRAAALTRARNGFGRRAAIWA